MFVAVTTADQIQAVERLAREIWTEHYTPVIGRLQVEYMLGRFQSADAIAAQISEGYLYFLQREQERDVGYCAMQQRGRDLFLSKIYVRASERGKGRGREAVQFTEQLAREQGLSWITLTVNRHNAGSIAAYERMGFRKAGEVVMEIGNGFVMDDYRMEKAVG